MYINITYIIQSLKYHITAHYLIFNFSFSIQSSLLPLYDNAFSFTEGINSIDGGVRQVYGPKATAGIFATYPKDYLSITGGVIDQVNGYSQAVLWERVNGTSATRKKSKKVSVKVEKRSEKHKKLREE